MGLHINQFYYHRQNPKPRTKNQEPKKQREGKGKKNYKKKENRIAEGLIISFL